MNYVLVREHRIGMRERNQDYLGHDATEHAMVLAVADGLGGYFGGELAAEIAVGSLLHGFCSEAKPRLADPEGFLERALARAHDAIVRYARERALPEVPRTVIVACVVQDGSAWWNHVGDSRLYLVRDGSIEARTRDHTHVQEMVDAGLVAEDAMASHPESHRVLQSLGAPLAPEPGPGATVQLRKDDILLLCSDGFWGPLRPGQLLQGLAGRPIEQSIPELSDLAERRAGSNADNLTVIAVRWRDEAMRSAGEGASGSATQGGRRAGLAGGDSSSRSARSGRMPGDTRATLGRDGCELG